VTSQLTIVRLAPEFRGWRAFVRTLFVRMTIRINAECHTFNILMVFLTSRNKS
jgi:hypothetical protein